MAGAAMNEILRALAPCLAPLLLLAACGSQPAATPPGEAPLAGARIGGPFNLVDQDGKSVKDSDFAGKYRLMYFGYAYCPDVCPVDVQKLMQGLKTFEKTNPQAAGRLQPIFISVDPERDTPEVLKQFVGNFHPRLIGLTGSPQAIAAVAKDYAVYYRKAGDPKASDYLVDHSRQTYLMGPDGKPIALVPQDGTPQEIAAVLAQWVR
ncbi:SCO family protein [Sphingomonas cavernae]|uniref:SCO family protein n=1 Tax=Sphingomonas cavernae TaxID=2320861 RepID=A0A418WRA7_9SPHN|nr:SCO family protein [Sphingomonas cavernae]RJF93736.1 SCO family protein [Sphingomonas cavernae]